MLGLESLLDSDSTPSFSSEIICAAPLISVDNSVFIDMVLSVIEGPRRHHCCLGMVIEVDFARRALAAHVPFLSVSRG